MTGKVYFIGVARQSRAVARRERGDTLLSGRTQGNITALRPLAIEYEMVPDIPAALAPPEGLLEQGNSNQAEMEDAFRVYGDSWFRY